MRKFYLISCDFKSLIISLILVINISCSLYAQDGLVTPTVKDSLTPSCDQIFNIVENMPYIKDCNQINSRYKDKYECTRQMMLEYIYKNIKYSIYSDTVCLPERANIQFDIDANGQFRDIQCLKSSTCPDFDQIVLDVIKAMGKEIEWVAGVQNGRAVCIRYRLPINVNWGSR